MKKYGADKKAVFILSAMSILITVGIIIVILRFMYIFPILMQVLVGVCLVALVFGIFWMVSYFRGVSYTISPEEITRTAGVFFRKRQIMKPAAVQYITLVTTPFSAVSGLNFVIVNALGGNLLLLFLAKKDALELRESLQELLKIYS